MPVNSPKFGIALLILTDSFSFWISFSVSLRSGDSSVQVNDRASPSSVPLSGRPPPAQPMIMTVQAKRANPLVLA